MPEPSRASTAVETNRWYTHTAPTRIGSWLAPIASSRSARTGRRALAQSRRTRPGVSSPESVVRSIRVTARSSQAACHSFLTVRRPRSVAVRRSTALRFTRTSSTRSSSRGVPGFRGPPAPRRPRRRVDAVCDDGRLGHSAKHTSAEDSDAMREAVRAVTIVAHCLPRARCARPAQALVLEQTRSGPRRHKPADVGPERHAPFRPGGAPPSSCSRNQ